ncbi:MAG TPA: hydroxyisourate hydrolase [Candidatus Baltobacteraceae bacterium]|nr:hydroxyisourate hydrolase [Candidatus Baltobacteraceae bacterium]
MSATISTHVLDVARGTPAAGVPVALYAIDGEERKLIASAVTNDDGRTDDSLARVERAGTYELVFAAGAYLRALGGAPFLDDVPVRFVVAAPEGKYHVPLLLSGAGYTTYRGS